MQIYKIFFIYYIISTLKNNAKIRPSKPYEKIRIMQLKNDIILIKLSTSLQCRNALITLRKSSAI